LKTKRTKEHIMAKPISVQIDTIIIIKIIIKIKLRVAVDACIQDMN